MQINHNNQVIGCIEHLLSITPLKSNCYYKQQLFVSFCQNPIPRISNKSSSVKKKKKKQWKCISCPVYNQDNNHCSPAFILQNQKNYYKESFKRIMNEHENQMMNIHAETSEINLPKPKSKVNFCSVCRKQYDDYIQHIYTQVHRINIKKSRFNQYIEEIQEHFITQNPFRNKQKQKLFETNSDSMFKEAFGKISETYTCNETQKEQNDLILAMNPKKKVKLQIIQKPEINKINIQNQLINDIPMIWPNYGIQYLNWNQNLYYSMMMNNIQFPYNNICGVPFINCINKPIISQAFDKKSIQNRQA